MKRFLALYIGSATSEQKASAPPSAEVVSAGMAAWGEWMTEHHAAILDPGGPLGKTMQASRDGVQPTVNQLTGYVVVEATSHEAAAAMFSNHPHFAIFPGDRVEIMECLAIPGA